MINKPSVKNIATEFYKDYAEKIKGMFYTWLGQRTIFQKIYLIVKCIEYGKIIKKCPLLT